MCSYFSLNILRELGQGHTQRRASVERLVIVIHHGVKCTWQLQLGNLSLRL